MEDNHNVCPAEAVGGLLLSHLSSGGLKAFDLTHTLEEGMPSWPTQARYGSVVYESYEYGDQALHSGVTMSEHTGTHIDAPVHFVKGAVTIDKLPVTQIIGRGANIDATAVSSRGVFTLSSLKAFEAENDEIRQGDIVMFRFGWDGKYGLRGDAAEFLRDWPGLDGEAALYLRDKKVAAVGCDALSIDAFGSAGDVCHYILLGSGIPIIENICGLEYLPVFSFVIGLPNKFKDGSGSPIRLVAFA
ncbi:polyketide cyclase [Synergistales bacterium]|nr:polyketide cyclase [Synergistales bacterium]